VVLVDRRASVVCGDADDHRVRHRLPPDVVLMKSDPYDIVGAIELSRATLRKMHQNLWWAVGYNVIAFPLVAGVLYPFTLSPEIAALSMSGSSAVVAINALLLKRTKLAGIKSAQPTPAAAPAAAEATA
jgi:Cu2+-exporting ATPase